ncbi:MAG: PAS domain-containing protein [Candidatus Melainabacteria bacterium]|nr:PAS domain-containing protein [Candidatus Melainabacteria bacterium]
MSDSSRLNTEDSDKEFFLAEPALENERQLLAAELAQLHAEERALSVAHSLAKLAYRKTHSADSLLLDMGKSEDRKKVLLEGESRFEFFVESTVVPCYKVDKVGRITYGNQALANYLGYERQDLLAGLLTEDQITPRNWHLIDAEHVKDLSNNLISRVWESERLSASGKKMAVGVTLRLLNEETAERVVFLLDLQEIRQLEDDLKQRQTLFSALVQEMPHIVFVCNSKGCMRQFNERFYELTGLVPSADNGFAWRDVIHEEDLPKWDKLWHKAVASNSSFSGEFRISASDGEYYWHIVRALPLVNPIDGQVDGLIEITIENATSSESCTSKSGDSDSGDSGDDESAAGSGLWVGTATDIDRRKRLMEEVLESAHAFQSLADQIPQIVWTAGPDGRVDFFSNRWFEFSGLTREHRVGLDFALFMHPDDRKEYMSRWRQCVKTGDAFEADVRLKARKKELASPDVYVKFLARAVALRNYRGGIAQWVGTWTSID